MNDLSNAHTCKTDEAAETTLTIMFKALHHLISTYQTDLKEKNKTIMKIRGELRAKEVAIEILAKRVTELENPSSSTTSFSGSTS